jgi:RNA polymerase sigma-70 factor (ECF subfamily)
VSKAPPLQIAEQELVRKAQEGDREAFEELVRNHMKSIYSLSYRLTANHADADDMTQQTFINAYQKLSRFDPGTNFRGWILTIAANLCRDIHRRRKVRREVALAGACGSRRAVPDPAEEVIRDEGELRIWEALAALPEEQRAVLVLHAMEDVSLADIARGMACPEGTVRWRFFQARNRLRDLLGLGSSPDRGEEGENG